MKPLKGVCVCEWILLAVWASCFAQAVCSGFVLQDPVSASVWLLLLICAAWQAFLLFMRGGKIRLCLEIGLLIVLFAWAVYYAGSHQILKDEKSASVFITGFIVVTASLLTFWMARGRVGIMVMGIIGIFVIAGAGFLKFPIAGWVFPVYVTVAALLYLLRYYRVSASRAQAGNLRALLFIRQGCLLCLVAAALAGVLYLGVVRPLHPPTRKLQLIERLEQMNLLKVVGVSSERLVFVPDKTSDQTPDDTKYDRDEADNQNEKTKSGPKEEPSAQDEQKQNQNASSDAQKQKQQPQQKNTKPAQQVTYFKNNIWKILLPVILAAAAVISCYLIRLYRLKKWQERLLHGERTAAVVQYYQFFLNRLKKIGLGKADHITLQEFAAVSAVHLEPFQAGDADFKTLTEIYEKVVYGSASVSEEELQYFTDFYQVFHRNLRREIGTLKYYLTVFRF